MQLPVFRLYEDILSSGTAKVLPALPRMIFVLHGEVMTAEQSLTDGQTWHGEESLSLQAGNRGASVWRWELDVAAGNATEQMLPGVRSQQKLSAPLSALPQGELLLRGDSVAFPAGGCAYLHRHQGPGIRCLIEGGIRIDTQGTSTSYGPGGAWYESGPEPVFAQASSSRSCRFIRVMILPRGLLGKSSIQYVNDEDRSKPRVQQYKLFADAPIARPG